MFARLAVVLAAPLVLALAACGGGGLSGAAAIYSDAGEAMAASGSYHVVVDGFDAGEPFAIEYDLVGSDTFQTSFAMIGPDGPINFNVIGIDGQIYQQFSDFSEDWFIAPEGEFADLADIWAFFTALTTEASDLKYLGEEDISGIATYHLEGTLGREVIELIDTESSLPESITVELWVGKDDSLLHRTLFAPDIPDETRTLTFSDFDAVSVQAPADPRSLAELEEMFVGEEFEDPADVQEPTPGFSQEQLDCLRRGLGDEAFDELIPATRAPTEEEEKAITECFFE